jgi:hypothetical protein
MDKRICIVEKHKTPSQLRRDARKNEQFFKAKFATNNLDLIGITRTIKQNVEAVQCPKKDLGDRDVLGHDMGTVGKPESGGCKSGKLHSRKSYFSSIRLSEDDKDRIRKGPRDWWTDFRACIHMEDGIRQYHTARSQAHHKWWINRQSELAEQERREEERSNLWYRKAIRGTDRALETR